MDKKIYLLIPILVAGLLIGYLLGRQREEPQQIPSGTERRPAKQIGLGQMSEEYQRMIKKDPKNPSIRANLGDLYFESGRYQEAIEQYKTVLELNPKDVDTLNDIGLAHYYTGKPDLALQYLKKGIEVDPLFQRVWLSLGFVFVSMGNTMEAKDAWQKAYALNPNSETGIEAKKFMERF